MKVDLFLPQSFLLGCDLYYEQPQRVIQYFIEAISLPEYFSRKANKEKEYATLFFLEFQSRPNSRQFPVKKIREKYLDYQTLVFEAADQLDNVDNKFEMLDQFYTEWHFELIKNISKNDVIINKEERKNFFGYQF